MVAVTGSGAAQSDDLRSPDARAAGVLIGLPGAVTLLARRRTRPAV